MRRQKLKPTSAAENFDGAWAALMVETARATGRPEGEGWKTAKEFADACGHRWPHTMKERLAQWERDGKMESARGTANGRAVTFYRPKLAP